MNAFFFPRLHKVEALAPCNLRTWSTGEVLDVDVESALRSNPALCDILAPSVFALVHIGSGLYHRVEGQRVRRRQRLYLGQGAEG